MKRSTQDSNGIKSKWTAGVSPQFSSNTEGSCTLNNNCNNNNNNDARISSKALPQQKTQGKRLAVTSGTLSFVSSTSGSNASRPSFSTKEVKQPTQTTNQEYSTSPHQDRVQSCKKNDLPYSVDPGKNTLSTAGCRIGGGGCGKVATNNKRRLGEYFYYCADPATTQNGGVDNHRNAHAYRPLLVSQHFKAPVYPAASSLESSNINRGKCRRDNMTSCVDGCIYPFLSNATNVKNVSFDLSNEASTEASRLESEISSNNNNKCSGSRTKPCGKSGKGKTNEDKLSKASIAIDTGRNSNRRQDVKKCEEALNSSRMISPDNESDVWDDDIKDNIEVAFFKVLESVGEISKESSVRDRYNQGRADAFRGKDPYRKIGHRGPYLESIVESPSDPSGNNKMRWKIAGRNFDRQSEKRSTDDDTMAIGTTSPDLEETPTSSQNKSMLSSESFSKAPEETLWISSDDSSDDIELIIGSNTNDPNTDAWESSRNVISDVLSINLQTSNQLSGSKTDVEKEVLKQMIRKLIQRLYKKSRRSSYNSNRDDATTTILSTDKCKKSTNSTVKSTIINGGDGPCLLPRNGNNSSSMDKNEATTILSIDKSKDSPSSTEKSGVLSSGTTFLPIRPVTVSISESQEAFLSLETIQAPSLIEEVTEEWYYTDAPSSSKKTYSKGKTKSTSVTQKSGVISSSGPTFLSRNGENSSSATNNNTTTTILSTDKSKKSTNFTPKLKVRSWESSLLPRNGDRSSDVDNNKAETILFTDKSKNSSGSTVKSGVISSELSFLPSKPVTESIKQSEEAFMSMDTIQAPSPTESVDEDEWYTVTQKSKASKGEKKSSSSYSSSTTTDKSRANANTTKGNTTTIISSPTPTTSAPKPARNSRTKKRSSRKVKTKYDFSSIGACCGKPPPKPPMIYRPDRGNFEEVKGPFQNPILRYTNKFRNKCCPPSRPPQACFCQPKKAFRAEDIRDFKVCQAELQRLREERWREQERDAILGEKDEQEWMAHQYRAQVMEWEQGQAKCERDRERRKKLLKQILCHRKDLKNLKEEARQWRRHQQNLMLRQQQDDEEKWVNEFSQREDERRWEQEKVRICQEDKLLRAQMNPQDSTRMAVPELEELRRMFVPVEHGPKETFEYFMVEPRPTEEETRKQAEQKMACLMGLRNDHGMHLNLSDKAKKRTTIQLAMGPKLSSGEREKTCKVVNNPGAFCSSALGGGGDISKPPNVLIPQCLQPLMQTLSYRVNEIDTPLLTMKTFGCRHSDDLSTHERKNGQQNVMLESGPNFNGSRLYGTIVLPKGKALAPFYTQPYNVTF